MNRWLLTFIGLLPVISGAVCSVLYVTSQRSRRVWLVGALAAICFVVVVDAVALTRVLRLNTELVLLATAGGLAALISVVHNFRASGRFTDRRSSSGTGPAPFHRALASPLLQGGAGAAALFLVAHFVVGEPLWFSGLIAVVFLLAWVITRLLAQWVLPRIRRDGHRGG